MACNAPTRESDSGSLIRLGQNPLARALPPDTQGSGLSMWGATELAWGWGCVCVEKTPKLVMFAWLTSLAFSGAQTQRSYWWGWQRTQLSWMPQIAMWAEGSTLWAVTCESQKDLLCSWLCRMSPHKVVWPNPWLSNCFPKMSQGEGRTLSDLRLGFLCL